VGIGWLIVDGLRVPLNTKAQVPVGKHLFSESAHYICWGVVCQCHPGFIDLSTMSYQMVHSARLVFPRGWLAVTLHFTELRIGEGSPSPEPPATKEVCRRLSICWQAALSAAVTRCGRGSVSGCH